MKRQFLFSFFETPQGKLLLEQEKKFLARSITVSYQQIVLQIGGLGWENEFVDCSHYKKYYILDARAEGSVEATLINARSFSLPLQSESVDLVIVPHLIEFDANRFQTMREIERVLKPEGEVVILNFNPLNVWVRMQIVWNKKFSDTWHGHFLPRSRVADWLKLLNFEIKSTTEFTIDRATTTCEQFKLGRLTFSSIAYAVRAVKRQYTLIPLTPIKAKKRRLAISTTAFKLSKKQKTS